jgi:hypothetical protein
LLAYGVKNLNCSRERSCKENLLSLVLNSKPFFPYLAVNPELSFSAYSRATFSLIEAAEITGIIKIANKK